MKTVDNYKNFDIKRSKIGNFFVYSDDGLSEYVEIKFNVKYKSIEEAKAAIDRYWEQNKWQKQQKNELKKK
ncbi:hypothetical protein [Lactococcus garvieae]|uniref:hypothetical protein n=1 Tax=Lactococcus garvieae TaxID=1363 RepID=UPI00030A3F01|nr:hypothetical protein [Lactococcus garvieae]